MAETALLLVNGNTTAAVTDRLARQARAFAPAGIDIAAVTAPFGARYIQSRLDAAIAAHAILVALAREVAPSGNGAGGHGTHRHRFDAAIIGCFGEPGLLAARDMLDIPVVGMAEAAMLTACQLGRRFVIVTAGLSWPAMLSELVATYGLAERCAGIAALPASGLEVSRSGRTVLPRIVGLIRRTVAETRADVAILGGAGFAGMIGQVRRRIDVPVVDGLEAALGQAIQLAGLNGQARAAPRAPAASQLIGVDPSLTHLKSRRTSRPRNSRHRIHHLQGGMI